MALTDFVNCSLLLNERPVVSQATFENINDNDTYKIILPLNFHGLKCSILH